MPGGKIYLSAPKRTKRKYTRKNKFGTVKASTANLKLSANRSLIPNRFVTKLVYESGNIGTTTTTSLGTYQFRCNSLYDPDYTSTGHQPRGFNELEALYTNYKVYGVKVELLADTSTANETGIIAMGYHSSTANNITSINDILEDRQTIQKLVTSDRPLRIKSYLSMAKIFSRSKKDYQAERDYGAGVGANPTKHGTINVFWQNLDGVTSTAFTIRVRLTYFCEFFQAVNVSQST